MRYIVTHMVRSNGAIGAFVGGQFTLETATPLQARDQAFEAWHARGCETAGFSVHEEETRALVLGGETPVCGQYEAEHELHKARFNNGSPHSMRKAARRAIAEADEAFGGEPIGPELAEPPPDPRLEFCPDAKLVHYDPSDETPSPWAVEYMDDIIGAGMTAEEALAEAREQVAAWHRADEP